MKSMLKKFLCFTLALLPALLVAACEDKPTAAMVRLKTESELRQIAEEECPPNEQIIISLRLFGTPVTAVTGVPGPQGGFWIHE